MNKPNEVAIRLAEGGDVSAGDNGIAVGGAKCRVKVQQNGVACAGDYGEAQAAFMGTAVAGDHGKAVTGDNGTAAAGYNGVARAGDWGTACAENWGKVSAGNYGVSRAGYMGTAEAGERGTAVSHFSSSVGRNGVAVVRGWRGFGCRIRGETGAVLLFLEEDRADGNRILDWGAVRVDGEKIKSGRWYRFEDGVFEEIGDDE